MDQKRILFIISEDWYFVSHRFYLAKLAIKKGYSVTLLCNFTKHKNEIQDAGINIVNWGIDRKSKNIFKELIFILKTIFIFKKIKPNLIHAVALKPVIYSAISSYILRLSNRVFALGGLGSIFTSNEMKIKLFRPFLKLALKFLLKGKHTRLILQNPENIKIFTISKIIDFKNIRLIRGAGVDTKLFNTTIRKENIPVIALPGRMLYSKGVNDFITCSKKINKSKKKARFVLIGKPDLQNPGSLTKKKLEELNEKGDIEWWGHHSRMFKVFEKISIVCLPTSYGEGLPKVLLEAASSRVPIIAYDVPGCREIVVNNTNGFLIPLGDINGLCKSINVLLEDKALSAKMGKKGRGLVLKSFSQEKISEQTISIWRELLP